MSLHHTQDRQVNGSQLQLYGSFKTLGKSNYCWQVIFNNTWYEKL